MRTSCFLAILLVALSLDLLSPSAVRVLADADATKVFDDRAPGYLAGVVTGELVWLLALLLAWWRVRRWRAGRAAARSRR